MNVIKKANDTSDRSSNHRGSKAHGLRSVENPSEFARRESAVRSWIARNESVCPYAPGLVYFSYLPETERLDMQLVRFLVVELRKFYASKCDGERVGRWMILPYKEWTSHKQARKESEIIFWGLAAAYFYLRNDRRRVKLALSRSLPGYAFDETGDITNPVVGNFARAHKTKPHPKSLFCSALSPLYRSKEFYRYAPSSVMVMVYALEFFEEKEKNEKSVRKISLDMAYGNLCESLGASVNLDKQALKKELPAWEQVIAQSLSVSGTPIDNSTCFTSGVLDKFRQIQPHIVEVCVSTQKHRLPILSELCRVSKISYHDLLSNHFSGAGLYTLPHYF